MPVLESDHAAGFAVLQHPLQVIDGPVAEVAGVLDVVRDGGRAADLVADVLALDGDLLPSRPEAILDLAGEQAVQLVSNLMTDAMTTQRWYLVVAMGRSAGHLALGIGKAAGATLTLIAEEFPRDEPVRLSRLVDILETSMLKRIAHGRPFGVAVLAEGIGLRLPQDELLEAMPEVELDEHGNIRLAELELDRLLAKQVRDRFRQRGQRVTVEGRNIGPPPPRSAVIVAGTLVPGRGRVHPVK